MSTTLNGRTSEELRNILEKHSINPDKPLTSQADWRSICDWAELESQLIECIANNPAIVKSVRQERDTIPLLSSSYGGLLETISGMIHCYVKVENRELEVSEDTFN
jgi:hypothetical protein